MHGKHWTRLLELKIISTYHNLKSYTYQSRVARVGVRRSIRFKQREYAYIGENCPTRESMGTTNVKPLIRYFSYLHLFSIDFHTVVDVSLWWFLNFLHAINYTACILTYRRCSEEGAQLKLIEVSHSPLVKQLLDTNVSDLLIWLHSIVSY